MPASAHDVQDRDVVVNDDDLMVVDGVLAGRSTDMNVIDYEVVPTVDGQYQLIELPVLNLSTIYLSYFQSSHVKCIVSQFA